jgi:uncharacterized SAM-binding protein YcdF (DUF218 family)
MSYLQPVLLLLIAAIAICLLRDNGRYAKRIRVAALAALFLWCWAPFGALASLTLEWPYGVATPQQKDVGAIVVLAGGVYPPDPSQREPAPAQGTYLRCQYAAWLYRHWRTAPIYAAGGSDGSVVLSSVMRRVLEGEGVPRTDVFTEEASTSTYTNATRTAAMLRARGIRKVALVTEGFHMLRSELCFRKQGIAVVPAPCAFRGRVFRPQLAAVFPGVRGMMWNADALHEWVGLLWYWVSGKI